MSQVNTSSYRQIFKSTSLFGGVQLYQILLTVIRSKLVAMILGPAGMGISGLLVSATTLITSVTGLGLNVSGVRFLAEATREEDKTRLARLASLLRWLMLMGGLLGCVVMVMTSAWVSESSFQSTSYQLSVCFLAITFIISGIASYYSLLLQGLRMLSSIAWSNLVSVTGSLLVSIPLYYWLGVDGIIPALVASSIVTLATTRFFARKISLQKIRLSIREVWQEGGQMMRLGIFLTLSTLVASLVSYIQRVFIGEFGSIQDVGLYGAGFAIVNTYVGMIFTAMSTDYYPRLAGLSADQSEANKLVNQQSEMAILILTPILILFLISVNFVIVILYSDQFLPCVTMVQWATLGIFFKALSWSSGYLMLAKGNSRLFFWNELTASAYSLALSLAGYWYWGLSGLGISFLLSFVLSSVQNFLLTRWLYGYAPSRQLMRIFILQGTLTTISFMLMVNQQGWMSYLFAGLLLSVATFISWRELNARLEIVQFVKSRFKRGQ